MRNYENRFNEKQTATGVIILLMGISGSGKTTLGKKLKEALETEQSNRVEFIDGDNTRQFIGNELGYTEQDRFLITKVIVYAAALLAKNGVHVVVSNIAGKEYVREYMAAKWKSYIQIFLDAEIETCIANDPKGVYRKALQDEHPQIMGIDIPYDRPEAPDLILKPYRETIEQSLDRIIRLLGEKCIISKNQT